MATTTEGNQEARQQEAQQPNESARDRYRKRYQAAHPDMNLDDEDAFYAQANANLDELENYREADRQLGEAFDRTPELAGMVLAAKDGRNPFAYLAEMIGPDMDIRELANNPEFSQTMSEALTNYQKKQDKARADDEALKKQIGDNVAKSFGTLKELQQERGLSDEECVKLAKDFLGELDEEGKPVGKESFMQLASLGTVTKGMWESLIKGRRYDDDIASATDKAKAQALNQKVQNNLRSFGTGLPQSMPTGGAAKGEPARKKKTGFADFGKDL